MAFEKFTAKKWSATAEPRITVSKTGVFNFNRSCKDKLFEGKEAAVLLYDKDAHLIGIKPVPAKTEHAYSLRSNKSNVMQVSGTAFLRFYGIDHSKTKSYKAEWNKDLGGAVIDLNKPI